MYCSLMLFSLSPDHISQISTSNTSFIPLPVQVPPSIIYFPFLPSPVFLPFQKIYILFASNLIDLLLLFRSFTTILQSTGPQDSYTTLDSSLLPTPGNTSDSFSLLLFTTPLVRKVLSLQSSFLLTPLLDVPYIGPQLGFAKLPCNCRKTI
ncbi:hypothetical protein BDV37DRAFT_10845 [Aspergillus pseudonomiae]|uniref:Uncharacterized protein n=1 Tax=Aspergillus pseudonomiae TaxID=1506151 RepID=A0A5N7CYC8_9EURO|nr:uncharacterized protein BDV37DRAFT_10845 [Aspergillus pseudonomiae]KAE8399206.1 hypothetical protein BDV37DRAFT_10845 [Aspergillus pseudonomiae]